MLFNRLQDPLGQTEGCKAVLPRNAGRRGGLHTLDEFLQFASQLILRFAIGRHHFEMPREKLFADA